MKPYRIGIDWGGTRIKLGAVDAEGNFMAKHVYDSSGKQDVGQTVERLIGTTEELIQTVGHGPDGIGLGLTGPVDPDKGVVYLPGKIKGLENYPIVSQFNKHFGIPVTADNDGKVALFAERFVGKARNVDWVTVLTIGTGLGSGVLVNGEVLPDPNFLFGVQIGHIVIKSGDEPLCLTGARGTGEMHASATALKAAVLNGLGRGIPSTLSDVYDDDPRRIDFQLIIEKGVEQGDKLCSDELRRWTNNLGWVLVNAVHAYSSQMIILSGGATLGARHFLPDVQQFVNQHCFRYPPDREIPVVVSDIQEHAGVLGAAWMSLHRNP